MRTWPASFAFSNRLGFHVLAIPRAEGAEFTDYLREDQTGDYPEGRYEHGLQIAAEAGDQRELDRLFDRRSRKEVLRLAVFLMVAAVLLAVVMNCLSSSTQPGPETTAPDTAKQKVIVADKLAERVPGGAGRAVP